VGGVSKSPASNANPMSAYPDLGACAIYFMQFSFHVSGGMSAIDSFWADRGLARSKERLLFAGYSRKGRPHTAYIQWERSHDNCTEIYLGVEAGSPSKVWPHRSAKEHRLRAKDFRDFIRRVRAMSVPWGISARYAYERVRGLDSLIRIPGARPNSLSFEVLDEKKKPVVRITWERHGEKWLSIVEPLSRYPFPEGNDFFALPYKMGCSLSNSFQRELVP
jgi:hypothetical protein